MKLIATVLIILVVVYLIIELIKGIDKAWNKK